MTVRTEESHLVKAAVQSSPQQATDLWSDRLLMACAIDS
jgi:hypothetical protein